MIKSLQRGIILWVQAKTGLTGILVAWLALPPPPPGPLDQRGGVLFARNADGEEKNPARQRVLDLFGPEKWDRYRIGGAKFPVLKDLDKFVFADTPVDEGQVRERPQPPSHCRNAL